VLFLESRIAHGGDVQALLNILNHLDRESFEPIVACVPGGAIAGRHDLPEQTTLLEVPFGYGRHQDRRASLRSLVGTVIALRREILARGIRIVHSSNTKRTQTVAVAIKASLPRRVQLIYHAHSGPSNGITHRLGLRLSSRVWACSHSLAEEYRGAGVPQRKLEVVLNGYDFERPIPSAEPTVRTSLGIPADAPLAVLVGRLSPNKGQHLAIMAMADTRLPNDTHLVLVGDASISDGNDGYLETLVGLADELNLAQRVHFVGYQPDPTPYYASSDVVLIPSASEGFGLTALEAAAALRPIVATPAGGLTEVLGAACGLPLVDRDPSGLAAGMVRALAGLQDPDPAEVRRRAERAYGMTQYIRRVERSLLGLAAAGTTARAEVSRLQAERSQERR
jgi:glycosyltransferase involved in cell wall biosynthesis